MEDHTDGGKHYQELNSDNETETYNRHKISVTLVTNNGAMLLHIVICARTNS